MLTDLKLKSVKPREKAYKISDRDGMYVTVSPAGTISFRYDYRLNGRRETLTIGRYDPSRKSRPANEVVALDYSNVLSLQDARVLLDRARRSVEQGLSPSRAKVEKRTAINVATTFDGWAQRYFEFKADPKSGDQQLADSTLAVRKSTYKRVLQDKLGKLKLEEVTPQRLKALCDEAKAKRGPAVAVHAREVVLAVFRYAQNSGLTVMNPAETVKASSIATFKPRDRALSPLELRKFFAALEHVATTPTLRLALKFVLLTGVRKSEFIEGTWDEIDWEKERWMIPAARMKAGKDHIVYLTLEVINSDGKALFTVNNLGPIASNISEIYFDYGNTNFFALPKPAVTSPAVYTTTTQTYTRASQSAPWVLCTTASCTTVTTDSTGTVGSKEKVTGKTKTVSSTVLTTPSVTTPAVAGGLVLDAHSSSVNYQPGGTPPELPGGNIVSFTTDQMFSAKNPSPINGIHPGEYLSFLGTFSNGGYDALMAAMLGGDFRVGLHIQSIDTTGKSDSYVNSPSPVPLPAAAWLFGSALLGFMGLSNRRKV